VRIFAQEREVVSSSAKEEFERKKGNPFVAPPVRKEKIKEAKKKKQRGEYNTDEVYRKIADRLMDLFGVR
jgi:anti-sigma28 factor (negative regulator of flagellin synthesis)